MCKVFIVIFIFFVSNLNAQKSGSRSRYEKKWALSHPFAALKVKKIYKKCFPYYNEIKKLGVLDTCENGGKLDAFRHTFFMPAFAQKIKARKIRKLGIAHEKGNYIQFLNRINEPGELPDSLSSVMDLYNNELGLKIGSQNKKTDLKDLKDLVIVEIKKGNSVYFKRNSKGQYLNCDGGIIVLDDYKTKWFVPKCLIPSNN